MPAYLEISDAAALAASLGLSRFLAKDAGSQAALLLLATMDVDAAGPFQGMKYGVAAGTDLLQELEFPRVPYPEAGQWPIPGAMWPVGFGVWAGTFGEVWAWDATANAATVPPAVLMAVVLQADALCDSEAGERLEAIRSGLKAQSSGDASETYLSPADLAALGGGDGLCARAARLLKKYRLTSGSLR